MLSLRTRHSRSFKASPRRRRLRAGALTSLAALCLNLLVPLAVVTAAGPADADPYVCHVADDGAAGGEAGRGVPPTPPGTSAPGSHPGSHHCPLCLVLSGGVAASPDFATAVAVPPPPSHLQPYRLVPKLPPTAVRLLVPQPRAPPAARA